MPVLQEQNPVIARWRSSSVFSSQVFIPAPRCYFPLPRFSETGVCFSYTTSVIVTLASYLFRFRRPVLKSLLTLILSSVILSFSFTVNSQEVDNHPGRLFIVEIMGNKVVYHAGANKFFYPQLADTFNMILDEQLAYIEDMEFAGIRDWRIGYYHDVIPMKTAIFGSMKPSIRNTAPFFHTRIYFPYTRAIELNDDTDPRSLAAVNNTIAYYTHGRTGNEWGDPAQGGNGAFISIGPMRIGLPHSEQYLEAGIPIADEEDFANYQGTPGRGPWLEDGRPRTFYTMARSEAQDHWTCYEGMYCAYNDDLNHTPDDLSHCLQDFPQESDCGAWTVSEQVPQIWNADNKFAEIKISAAVHEDDSLVPVEILSVTQDEELNRKSRPDAKVSKNDQAAIVALRASRDNTADGRIYRIDFSDGANTYFMHIGVPNLIANKHLLVDSGPKHNSL